MKREKDLLKNTVILAVGYGIPAIVALVILPLYTSRLTKAEYGTYDLITILVSVAVPTITLQIKSAIFRFLIDCRQDAEQQKRYITTSYIFTLLTSAICFVLVLIFFPEITFAAKALIGIYLFQESFIDVGKQLSRGLGLLNKYVIGIVINSVSMLIASIVLINCMSDGFMAVLYSLNLGLLFANVYIALSIGLFKYIKLKWFQTGILKEMLAYSAPMVPNTISLWIVRLSDRLVVTAFLGVEMNAVYSIACKLPQYINQFFGIYNLSWQENASLAIADKDSSEYIDKISRQTVELLTDGVILFLAAVPFVFQILIDKSYADSYLQIPILTMGIFFSCLTSMYGSVYVALKKTKIIGTTSVAGAIINLVINLLLVKKIGLYAASLSTLISYVVIFAIRAWQLKKYIRLTVNKARLTAQLIWMAAVVAVYYYNHNIVSAASLAVSAIVFVILNKEALRFAVKKVKGKFNVGNK